jgi:hypothetical protein
MKSEELCGVTEPSGVVLMVQGKPDGQTAGARAASLSRSRPPKNDTGSDETDQCSGSVPAIGSDTFNHPKPR